jgi:hypothetical protein
VGGKKQEDLTRRNKKSWQEEERLGKKQEDLTGRRKGKELEWQEQDLEEGNGEGEMAGAALSSMLFCVFRFFTSPVPPRTLHALGPWDN